MNSRIVVTLAAAALMTSLTARAQSTVFELNWQGVARTTTESGKIVSKPIDTRDIIRKCAVDANLGTTNLGRFLLVYVVGGDYNGDVIRVVKKSDGSSICEPFRVLFQKSITGFDDRRDERIGFLFNAQSSDSMGSVSIVKKPVVRSDGSTGRDQITGKFQMFDEVYYPERKAILSGTFVTGKELNW